MDRKKWPIAAEAFPFVIPLAVLAIIFYYFIGYYLWLLPAALALFVLFFFRNPTRQGEAGEKELLSPADGKVMFAGEIPEEKEFLGGPALKISIFLNIYNVHINRSPIEGKVEHVRYRKGQFIPAFKSHASEINERNYLGLTVGAEKQKVLLVQIVGFVARRVVCWSRVGEHLRQGERFGLMKFGSCVELYLPPGTELYVKPGDKVKAGLTKLGRLP